MVDNGFMKEKKCFKCFEVKPLSYFYKHAQMGDGHLNKCKSCTKKDSNKRRNAKIQECREYDRKRNSLPHRVKLRNDLYEKNKNTDEYKKKHYDSNRKYLKNNPEKTKSKRAVQYAISSGKLKKESCRVCGNIKVEAHHEDYDFPLNIIWVCRKHHMEIHVKNGSFRKNIKESIA